MPTILFHASGKREEIEIPLQLGHVLAFCLIQMKMDELLSVVFAALAIVAFERCIDWTELNWIKWNENVATS